MTDLEHIVVNLDRRDQLGNQLWDYRRINDSTWEEVPDVDADSPRPDRTT